MRIHRWWRNTIYEKWKSFLKDNLRHSTFLITNYRWCKIILFIQPLIINTLIHCVKSYGDQTVVALVYKTSILNKKIWNPLSEYYFSEKSSEVLNARGSTKINALKVTANHIVYRNGGRFFMSVTIIWFSISQLLRFSCIRMLWHFNL